MILAILLLVFIGIGLWLCFVRLRPDEPTLPIDPEEAARAAVELHAIRRRLDVAWTKTEQRQDAARLRREIDEAFDDDDFR